MVPLSPANRLTIKDSPKEQSCDQTNFEFYGAKIVYGLTKEQVAEEYKVPIANIYEDTDVDAFPSFFTNIGSRFVIKHDPSPGAVNPDFQGPPMSAEMQERFQGSSDSNQPKDSGLHTSSRSAEGIFSYFQKAEEDVRGPEFKEHLVETGDTVWSIAKRHGMNVEQLLSVEGNEYLSEYRFQDAFGRDNIRIQSGFKIKIPIANKDSGYIWSRSSDYASPIKTTSGSYSFINHFNKGNYDSALSLEKLLNPYSYYTSRDFYGNDNSEIIKHLKALDLMAWKHGGYTDFFQDDEIEYLSESFDYVPPTATMERDFVMPSPPALNRVYQGTSFSSKQFNYNQFDRGYEIVYGNDFVALKGSLGELRFGGGGTMMQEMMGGHPAFGWRMFPVLIDLNQDDVVELIELASSTAFYDVDGKGFLKNVAWVKKDDAILVIDENKDGKISTPRELSFKLWDKNARTDLEGLQLFFDENKDGKLNNKDSLYPNLLIWQDYDQNGISSPEELRSLSEVGIEAIYFDGVGEESNSSKPTSILSVSKMQRNGHVSASVYDVSFEYSSAGILYEEDQYEITLKYDDGKSVKIYKIDNKDGESINLSESEYKVAVGGSGNDSIVASNSGMAIDGYEGDDVLEGGDGKDWLKGGKGSDTLHGGKGHDILLIDSEDKQENIDAGEGHDIAIVANKDGVKLNLSAANIESAFGNVGNDEFDSRASTEGVHIDGGEGNDVILGSDHSDILIGGKGNDSIHAGKGDDSLFIDSEDDIQNIDAGEGEDTVFVYGKKGVNIDLAEINAEIAVGSFGDDHIHSSGKAAVTLLGNDGNDYLKGGEGNDVLDGGKGNDKLEGSPGEDRFVFYKGSGHDVISNAYANNDLLLLYHSIKKEDLIFKRSGENLILLIRGSQNDSLTIENWFKEVDGKYPYKFKSIVISADTKEATNIVFKDIGDNSFRMEDGKETVIYSLDGNDRIGGSDKDDYINSGAGDDEVIGWEGNDIIEGGKGKDLLQGWKGDDAYIFYRGDGNDTIFDEYRFPEKREGKRVVKKTIPVRVPDRQCFTTPMGMPICFDTSYVINKEVKGEESYVETFESKGEAGNDSLVFKSHISFGDLIFTKDGNNLVIGLREEDITFENLSDKVTIRDWFEPFNKVENLVVGGVKLDLSKITNVINISQEEIVTIDTAGNDIINSSSDGSLTIISESGDDIIIGSSKKDQIRSKGGNSQIFGGAGDDELFSQKNNGTTILSGGSGKDVFVLSKKPNSQDILLDFNIKEDSIAIRGDFKSRYSFETLIINQEGADSVISLEDDQKIVLKNVEKETLSAKKFRFTGEKSGEGLIKSDDCEYHGCVLRGSYNSDELVAGDVGWHFLSAGSGDDVLRGGAGINVFFGYTGDDTIYCHLSGKDVLLYSNGLNNHIGHDVVHDFDTNVDKIKVAKVSEMELLTSSLSEDASGNAIFKGDGWSITLLGVASSDITVDNFDVWEEL